MGNGYPDPATLAPVFANDVAFSGQFPFLAAPQ